jgi:tripartite-type tricarboxylate transporter receptor subunit TctC
MNLRRHLLAMLLVPLLLPLSGLAQEQYPAKPISIVVAFPPGGVADLTARPMAIALERVLKQRVLVENKGGAGGAIGNAFVARAKPDGYTLLMALSSVSILPEADRVNGNVPAYELNQLLPIALVSADPTVLVVRSESPYKTLRDFIAAAKANPGKINYSSSGYYGALHTPMEMLSIAADIKLFHVPYQGGGPAVVALLGGQVDALASGPGPVVQQIKAGKLRALATTGARRASTMPGVPTVAESGYPGFEATNWYALIAPARTPPAILDFWNRELVKVLNDPQVVAELAKNGLDPAPGTREELAHYMEREYQQWGKVIREAKITAE